MNQYKKIVCSFADSRLNNSLKRVKKQAENMRFYDEIYVFNELSLDEKFREQFRKQLVKGSRGYGYWCWKPQIVLQMFEKMDFGDVVQYIDSGCHLNPKGIGRLRDYFEISKMSDSGLLAFRSKNIWELDEGEKYYEHTERRYTKSDVLNYFGVLGDSQILDTTQYEAGNFFIRKDQKNIDFLKKWISIFSEDFRMIDDSPSEIPNEKAFIDHRHDQSLYSLLCKKRGVEELFTSEYFVEDLDWNRLVEFPIWVKRDKNFSMAAKIEMFPNRVLNFLKRKFRG